MCDGRTADDLATHHPGESLLRGIAALLGLVDDPVPGPGTRISISLLVSDRVRRTIQLRSLENIW